MNSYLAPLVFLLLTACAIKPDTMTPVFEPTQGGPIWPLPPETARYGYAGTLIGERDFLAPEKTANKAKNVFAWIAGIVFGEPKYMELQRPVSGMVDGAGRILVVDAGHQAVLVFDMAAQQLLKWSYVAKGEKFVMPFCCTRL
ncbi:MAG: hypothetical protein JKY27_03895, partial [Magnetovibrio sp.]|nr:hypothetical protein [Magnetovibrio sp.]